MEYNIDEIVKNMDFVSGTKEEQTMLQELKKEANYTFTENGVIDRVTQLQGDAKDVLPTPSDWLYLRFAIVEFSLIFWD